LPKVDALRGKPRTSELRQSSKGSVVVDWRLEHPSKGQFLRASACLRCPCYSRRPAAQRRAWASETSKAGVSTSRRTATFAPRKRNSFW